MIAVNKSTEYPSKEAAGQQNSKRERRQRLHQFFQQKTQQGWKLKEVTASKVSFVKPKHFRRSLLIIGIVLLPAFGLGLLFLFLGLLDYLLPKEEQSFTIREILENKPPAQILIKSDLIALVVFSLFVLLWTIGMNFYVLPLFDPDKPDVVAAFGSGLGGMIDHMMNDDVEPTPSDTEVIMLFEPSVTSTPTSFMVSPTITPFLPYANTSTVRPSPTITETLIPTDNPMDWMEFPVIPEISQNAIDLYHEAVENGADPHAFSVVGDCQSIPYVFMGVFDYGGYTLNEDQEYLEDTIDWFEGSFSRYGMTNIDGGNAATQLAVGWANRNWCSSNESPLTCELRLNNPSIVLIQLGTHWSDRNGQYLSQIIQTVIDYGALPVLATKADNLEGDHSINQQIAWAAIQYDIPLWNFWASVQDLPNSGLDAYRQGGGMYLIADAQVIHRNSALEMLDQILNSTAE